jgi:hypothetical protein
MSDDKCKICALKVRFDQDNIAKELEVENFFTTLRGLQEKNVIEKGYNRRIFASIGTDGSGDKSEMCAVNSKFFLKDNRDNKCPEFILNMGLRVPEALALNTARSTDRLTAGMHKMTQYILVLGAIAVIVGIVAIICA